MRSKSREAVISSRSGAGSKSELISLRGKRVSHPAGNPRRTQTRAACRRARARPCATSSLAHPPGRLAIMAALSAPADEPATRRIGSPRSTKAAPRRPRRRPWLLRPRAPGPSARRGEGWTGRTSRRRESATARRRGPPRSKATAGRHDVSRCHQDSWFPDEGILTHACPMQAVFSRSDPAKRSYMSHYHDTRNAKQAGATREQVTEAAFLAAALARWSGGDARGPRAQALRQSIERDLRPMSRPRAVDLWFQCCARSFCSPRRPPRRRPRAP